MYFDPRGDSDLECLLRETEFSPDLLARAERLAARLVERGITKYNLAAGDGASTCPPDRRCILVPGQVEDDLSIRFGGGEVRSNLALLARCAPPIPTPSSSTSRTRTCWPGTARAPFPRRRRAALPTTSWQGGSTAALLAVPTNCTR